ncbi:MULTISPECIES: glycine cleavage system aminomethyltransferase GcvT [Ochrobactrum]|jgi:aminomethyltransferase|uniref:aminomethyltransferase n=1 Tax=Ochrobactrum quorumnocens TaxID=271865 RepID=A0A5N1K264_9HYPH|nr:MULTISPECIES: glycine cleavage system aminomethyltransferase GcvT [Brucella/Ochrobactrum group]KAA9369629.1 glycine cleavage system aminomethyltransferase GcvT [[Ochrobactrum] quorumnocens]MBD7990984.1 glycine cleavage system aminomethyltransferase GcvT [Ochrobactrum gallinarum]MDH7790797.1 aminomethyltransferase [Ochrobactrum sp. AN78]
MGDTAFLNTLPLHDLHEEAGARFGGFAGWNMPITYPLGVMKEHLHTRVHVGLFDISHMKLIEVSGPEAAELLEQTCPLDPSALGVGQSKYTFFLNEKGGVLDDLIVTRLGEDRYMVVANAGNADADIEHLNEEAAGKDVKVNPLDRVFIAIQGPEADSVIKDLGLAGSDLSFMNGFEPKAGWFMTRSGYTGEDGFEVGLPADEARELVKKLLADERVEWIGLAARDSLRLEAGLCLHGQDITPETDPVSAGLTWAISKPVREKAAFNGAPAVLARLEQGVDAKRVGLKAEGRQPVRAGVDLFDESGRQVGTVTSGGFGPSAGFPVAMGYVELSLAKPGTRIFAEVRGNKVPVDVSALPFTPHRYRKG